MMDSSSAKRENYRDMVGKLGKKEFTLLKMQEYGFWPKDLPTPYEIQKNESPESYAKRKKLLKEYEKIIDNIAKVYEEKDTINDKLKELKKKYDETWDYEKIRLDVAQQIFKESIERRENRKRLKEEERIKRSNIWKQKKSENIVFIGKGYSNLLKDKESNKDKLLKNGLPIIEDDKALAEFLRLDYSQLRFLAYHRDVTTCDNYYRYIVPKRNGKLRNIAAPKSVLKFSQKRILEDILGKLEVSKNAHGFLKEKSVITGALAHGTGIDLLINMDLEDFFQTITFERVRGMFKSFGYSGYISSLLAILCTYCERMEIEVKGEKKYVATSRRVLPQGSPASPMITNILCLRLDKRLEGLASKYGFLYTRYADDMSFSLEDKSKLLLFKEEKVDKESENKEINKFLGLASKIIIEEGFKINKSKTKFLRKNNRQYITGIVINNKEIGVPKKWVRNLRATIHNASKLKINGDIPDELVNEISGKVAWLRSVNGERYKAIIEKAMEVIK
ncbi:RNA-directed DNA polymerase [Clostridium cavendishii DSM 21758]|uniref:RNA-directed DNA polymerase n=1 Tax=Clostridium cavendishii DSM 21758 TaxID=1121302 RepID=A0A1M6GXD1_9CLOT|nr:reverse transcriptase family protein [Clostridium cavendishii]SHJ14638.1 RNA-directed DNA polymerase [Clostridium cavendishii DSM 21758]